MKRFFKHTASMAAVLTAALCLLCSTANAQKRAGTAADDIVGTYSVYNKLQTENFHLNFYKSEEGDYEARIVWMDRPDDNLGKPRTDVYNKHTEQRHIPLSQVVIVRDLEFNAKRNKWEGGRVYDPTTGKTYRCFIEFENDTTIRMKGYVGFRLFGKSLYWSKISE